MAQTAIHYVSSWPIIFVFSSRFCQIIRRMACVCVRERFSHGLYLCHGNSSLRCWWGGEPDVNAGLVNCMWGEGISGATCCAFIVHAQVCLGRTEAILRCCLPCISKQDSCPPCILTQEFSLVCSLPLWKADCPAKPRLTITVITSVSCHSWTQGMEIRFSQCGRHFVYWVITLCCVTLS